MKKKKASKEFEIVIEKLVYEGAGLGRHQGKVVFVPFSVPGDQLLVRPVEEKKTFIRAEIARILKPGNGRVAPECPHFGRCGGCHWQQLEYPRQVEAKRQILEEIFYHRFPQTRAFAIRMRACAQPFAYRSRARVQLRGSGPTSSVGFFRSGSHTVEDVDSCPLLRPSLNEALGALRQFKLKVDKNSKPQEMDIACSEGEDTWATAPVEAGTHEGARGEEVILRRKVGAFSYSVTASVFFQANDFMVSELVALVEEVAKSSGGESALDLFAGAGLFTLPLARHFAEIVAVENSPSACRLCSNNAKAAGLGHIQVACADACAWLDSEGARRKFDLIVLDPPRTGAGPDLMKRIGDRTPHTILYVSCNPQTLVRDLALISPRDYRIERVEGLDLFPQTYHFETVVHLIKN
jgi:23S rRNA (uracil1939-C5)-methyltransferase